MKITITPNASSAIGLRSIANITHRTTRNATSKVKLLEALHISAFSPDTQRPTERPVVILLSGHTDVHGLVLMGFHKPVSRFTRDARNASGLDFEIASFINVN